MEYNRKIEERNAIDNAQTIIKPFSQWPTARLTIPSEQQKGHLVDKLKTLPSRRTTYAGGNNWLTLSL